LGQVQNHGLQRQNEAERQAIIEFHQHDPECAVTGEPLQGGQQQQAEIPLGISPQKRSQLRSKIREELTAACSLVLKPWVRAHEAMKRRSQPVTSEP